MDFSITLNGYTLEYFDREHLYLVDGLSVPSVTQIIHQHFKNKYDGVSTRVLNRASEHGTMVHEAIENYCRFGQDVELKELRNYKFLAKHYKFKAIANEVPIILFENNNPVCAGRLDLVLEMDGKTGLGDIKSTAVLDKNYLAYQLNMYRLAYQQCYGTKIEFLKGIQLKEDKRKFCDLPINEELVTEILSEWRKNNE